MKHLRLGNDVHHVGTKPLMVHVSRHAGVVTTSVVEAEPLTASREGGGRILLEEGDSEMYLIIRTRSGQLVMYGVSTNAMFQSEVEAGPPLEFDFVHEPNPRGRG